MSYDLPTDLIRQVQILTRKESGLPEYDPDDRTLSPLPSVSAAVATFDASPPDLRCKHCRGRLLRGLQSVIWVYCGQKLHQSDDASVPDPISFNSTVSYRWLLQSLLLDGSEKVGTPSEKGEKTEANRRHSTPKDNICLSELLDLKIRLFSVQQSEINGASKETQQGNSSLNYTGIDLDNFFCRPKCDNTSCKQPATSYPVENEIAKTVATPDYSLFQNVQSFQPAVTTSQNNKTDDFSGWEADFRSADSETQSVSKTSDPVFGSTVDSESQVGNSNSSNAFVSSAVDLSAEMDSIFGSSKVLNESKTRDESAAFNEVSNGSSDDLGNNATTEAFEQKGTFDRKVEVNDSQQQNSVNTPIIDDWFQDNQFPTNVVSAPNPNATNIDEDSFDDWNDFTSSSTVKDPLGKATTQNDVSTDMDSIFGSGKDLNESKKGDESVAFHEVSKWSSDDLWSNATTEAFEQKGSFDPMVGVNNSQQQNNLNTPITDWFQDSQWPTNVASAPKPDATNIDEDSFDDWNDFTSSSTVKDPLGKGITQNDNQVDFPLDTLVSDNATAPNYDAMNVGGGIFDDWNDFTASTAIKDSQAKAGTQNDNHVVDALENTSELNLFCPSKFDDMDFSSFSHSDLFSSSHHTESISEAGAKTIWQDHPLDSIADAKSNLSGGAGKAVVDEDTFNTSLMGGDTLNTSIQSNTDIESLFSQMHDLSFMLESNLSIPPKSDVHRSPQD
nr:Dentin sialoprotein [Ipomoea batatas]